MKSNKWKTTNSFSKDDFFKKEKTKNYHCLHMSHAKVWQNCNIANPFDFESSNILPQMGKMLEH